LGNGVFADGVVSFGNGEGLDMPWRG